MKKKVWKAFILLFFCMFTPLLLQAQTEEEKKILQEREEISKQRKGGSVIVDKQTALEMSRSLVSRSTSSVLSSRLSLAAVLVPAATPPMTSIFIAYPLRFLFFSVFWQTGPPSVRPRVPRQAAGQAGPYVVSSGKVYRNSVNLSTL